MTGLSRRRRDDVNAQRHAKPAWPAASWVGTAISLLDALEAAEAERDRLARQVEAAWGLQRDWESRRVVADSHEFADALAEALASTDGPEQ